MHKNRFAAFLKKAWIIIVIAVLSAGVITGLSFYCFNVFGVRSDDKLSTGLVIGLAAGFALDVLLIILAMIMHNRRALMQKETQLLYREQLFDMLASKTDDVFLMLASNTFKVEYVSPNIERVLGIHLKDVQNGVEVLGKARYAKNQTVTYDMLNKMCVGSSLEFETERIHRLTKEHRFYSETIYRSEIDNSDKYIVSISDRTKELLAKQSLEEALNIAKVANQSKNTFLTNMSHDMRTPMNAIAGLCILLEKDSSDAVKVKEHIENLAVSCKHMMGIIDNILDMSSIESSSTTLRIEKLTLSEIIKELDNVIRPQATAKNQNFNIVVAVKEDKIMGDKALIKRVMLNILNNAVKYTPEGGRIDFSVRQMARAIQRCVRLQFVVKDNGIGMSEKYINRVFEPFSREVNAVTSRVEGTGLGLSIAKNLVELMGGAIAVESKQGAGSTFTVNLKFQLAEEGDSEDFFVAHGIGNMLVIGCNDADSRGIINAMNKEDVSVSFAPNLKSAVGMLDKADKLGNPFNVALCDWQGIAPEERAQTVSAIKGRLPALTPIIAFGERDFSGSESEAAIAGVNAFLGKPFSLTAFKDCLDVNKSKKRKGENDGKNALSGLHFLAAEDNELNSGVLVELLKVAGATCKVVPNGKEAVEEFKKSEKGEYSAVIMDLKMPVMDGYAASRGIRACGHPDAKRVPIIAVTANEYAVDEHSVTDAGINAYLIKPFKLEMLEMVIGELKK